MGGKSNFYEEMSAVNLMQVQYSPNKGHFVSTFCGSLKTGPGLLPADVALAGLGRSRQG